MQERISPLSAFSKTLEVAADKSISHRGVMFSSLAKGKSRIHNALMSDDVLSTARCIEKLGAKVKINSQKSLIIVKGGKKFKCAKLDAGNSGTTMRILTGLLAGIEDRNFVFDGDASLRKRPMGRVSEPLARMGAKIETTNGNCPIKIEGTKLKSIKYTMAVDSAQVKSAIILAGLKAEGETVITERVKSRDHTERMLKAMGAQIKTEGLTTTVKKSVLKPLNFTVPGDISSAAFLMVLAALKKDGYVKIEKVGINPTRTGILKVFDMCGVEYRLSNVVENSAEPYADIEVFYSQGLKPFKITKEMVPSLVDEIPILAVLASFIKGETVIKGAEELKVKESNRLDIMAKMLSRMGGDCVATYDGLIIRGKSSLEGDAEIETDSDHRIAMSMAVAAALSEKGAIINDAECVNISFPGFYELIR